MKPEVHQWTTRTEYFDVSDGVEITKRIAQRDYDILKKRKTIKIENFKGKITYTYECERKRQLKIF